MGSSKTRVCVLAVVLLAALAFAPLTVKKAQAIDNEFATGGAVQLHAQASTLATGTAGTCPWTLDSDGTLTVMPGDYAEINTGGYDNAVKKVVFKQQGGKKVVLGYSGLQLEKFRNMTSIVASGIDASSSESQGTLFKDYSRVTSIDLSGFSTAGFTNMSQMFSGCSSLTSLDLSGFDTSRVWSMSYMFSYCSSLETLRLSGLDTSNVTSMFHMLDYCSSLKSVDMSGLDMSETNNNNITFVHCPSLESINLSDAVMPKSGSSGSEFSCPKLRKIVLPKGFNLEFLKGTWVGPRGDVFKNDDFREKYISATMHGTWNRAFDMQAIDVRFAEDVSDEWSGFELKASYSGQPCTPAVHVQDGDISLEEGKEYKVTYRNNVDAGTAEAVVEGVGFGFGSKTLTFDIEPAVITDVAISGTSLQYTGEPQAPSIEIVRSNTLVLGPEDYTIAYSITNPYSNNPGSQIANPIDVGRYRMTVMGKGNFKGSKYSDYEISRANNTAEAAKASVKKTLKAKKLKKRAGTVLLPEVKTAFGKAKWRVVKKDKKKILSLRNGRVVVKKGAAKGSYAIKLKAAVSGTNNYTGASTKTVTVKVKVR